MDSILGNRSEQARDSPCFLCRQDLLVVLCVLDGQSPPGRVRGDFSFGQGLGSGAGPSKFSYVLGAHPGITGEGLAKVPKRPSQEPSVKSAGLSGRGALSEGLVRVGCALGKGLKGEGTGMPYSVAEGLGLPRAKGHQGLKD